MTMIEVKTADLIGAALDWAVAKAIGLKLRHQQRDGHRQGGYHAVGDAYGYIWTDTHPNGYVGSSYGWSPSRCWKDGGPLIDKYEVSIISQEPGAQPCAWTDGTAPWHGSTNLIAACRAIVAAKAGEIVWVPKELMP